MAVRRTCPGDDMRVRVLGAVELVDDRSLSAHPPETAFAPLRSAKQRRLLAALVIRTNAVVSIDWLADVLWGENELVNPDAAVQTLISRLRANCERPAAARSCSPGPPVTCCARRRGKLTPAASSIRY